MIIKIEDIKNAFILTDDARTPSVSLKSVEAQMRYDYSSKQIVIPKGRVKVVCTADVVYLIDGPDIYQINPSEVGLGTLDETVRFISDGIAGANQYDYVLSALGGIAELLQQNNELLKSILC